MLTFFDFVSWNNQNTKAREIGVLGAPKVFEILHKITTKKGNRHSRQDVLIRELNMNKPWPKVDILFVAHGFHEKWPEVFAKLEGQNVLIVGEDPSFLEAGGIIQFVQLKNRLRFRINNKKAERTGIQLSSKLLGLALEVM